MKTVTESLHFPGHGTRRGPVAFSIFLLCAVGHADHRQVTVAVSDEQVAVAAADVSLRAVLEALAVEGIVEVTAMDALERRVDVDTDPMPVPLLLHRLLRHNSYVYVETRDTNDLWILPSSNEHDGPAWHAGVRDELDRIKLDLTDLDPETRGEAVLSAADLAPGVATQLLIPVTTDPDPFVREAALAVLDDLGATDYAEEYRLTE